MRFLLNGFLSLFVSLSTCAFAFAQSDTILNIGYFKEWPTPNQAAIIDKKYEEELGVEVNWVSFDAGTAMSVAMAAGDIQIAYSQGLAPAVTAMMAGQELKIVGIAASYSDNSNCVVRSELGITKENIAELKGKKVAVPVGTSVHSDFLTQMAHFGIAEGDLEVVDMAPSDSAAAFAQPSTDFAMACGWGGSLRAMKQHGKPIIDGSEKEAIVGKEFDVITASTDLIKRRPDLIEKFLKVTDDANSQYSNNPDTTLDKIVQVAGMDANSASETLQTFRFPTISDQASKNWFGEDIFNEMAKTVNDVKKAGGISSSDVNLNEMVEPSFIKHLSKIRTMEIFFGTNRKPANQADKIIFTSERDEKLHKGILTVSVPEHRLHERGEVERPWELKIPFTDIGYKSPEDPTKHFTIVEMDLSNENHFYAKATDRASNSKKFKDQALIYIHGYNVTFNDAGFRLAQMVYDMGFDGVPFLYSWPSFGDPDGYIVDMESSELAAEYLKIFLESIMKSMEFDKMHIIAHSMGANALIRAIDQMNQDLPQFKSKINEIVLAAPDVDRDIFEKIYSNVTHKFGGATLYASSKDKAMMASKAIRKGQPRIGDVPAETGPLVLDKMHTIDISKLGGSIFGFEHSDYADEPILLKDISLLFSLWDTMRNPEMRGGGYIEQKNSSGKIYWKY